MSMMRTLPRGAAVCLLLPLLWGVAAGSELTEAKKLLRSRSADDRRDGVKILVALDSKDSVPPLEDAIRRSLKSMDKMAKEVDKADEALGKALGFAMYVQKRDPSLLSYAMKDVREAQAAWDELAKEMHKHLLVCQEVGDGLAAFRSHSAVKLVEKGARQEPQPYMRQLYVRALGRAKRARSIPILAELATDKDPRIRGMAVRAMRPFILEKAVIDALAAAGQDEHWSVRLGAYESMARAPFEHAVPFLVEAVEREEGQLAMALDGLLHALTGTSFEQTPKAWAAWWSKHEEAIRAGTYERPSAKSSRAEAEPTASTFFRIPIRSRNLLLAIDYSGSMTAECTSADARTNETREELGLPETRLGLAQTEAIRAIRALPDGALFNVVLYGTDATGLSKRPLKASKSTRRRAEKWILKQKTRGLTNIWDALRLSFADHLKDGSGRMRFKTLPDTIVFLTDGSPTQGRFQTAETLAYLTGTWNRAVGAVIHCVGIGEEHDAKLLRSLAKESSGFYVDLSKGAAGLESNAITVPPSERLPHFGKTLASAKKQLRDGTRDQRRDAALTLARMGWHAEPLAGELAKLLDDPFEQVAHAAGDALVAIGAKAEPYVRRQLDADDDLTQATALQTLARMGMAAEAAVPAVLALALKRSCPVRVEALKTLAAIGPKAESAADALQALTTDDDAEVAAAAKRALEQITDG